MDACKLMSSTTCMAFWIYLIWASLSIFNQLSSFDLVGCGAFVEENLIPKFADKLTPNTKAMMAFVHSKMNNTNTFQSN